ncbi:MAG: N-acetylmuramoyl-L-alanine amidase [Intestinibacillus sp.]
MAIKIFIDQGHNPSGPNTGAQANDLVEQDVNYIVGQYLASMLRRDPRFDVRLSRNTPTEILGTSNTTSLAERVRRANSWPADYFISIHSNANPNTAINGTEVYVYEQNSQPYWLAQHIVNGIVRRTGTRDNGVRLNPGLYVLRNTQMPSVLVELGYLTNEADAQKLRENPYGFAQGIYDGLLSYFGFDTV